MKQHKVVDGRIERHDTRGFGGCRPHGSRQWFPGRHPKEFGNINVLGRQAAAKHVVTRGHDLDARTTQVSVEVSGTEKECLTLLESHAIEQQGNQDSRVVTTRVCQPTDRFAFPRIHLRTVTSGRLDNAVCEIDGPGIRQCKRGGVG